MAEDPSVLSDARITRAPSLIRSQVADYLRQAIVSRRLLPGQLLVERELCQATTASRGSVREALRQLESEGLVVSEPGRGTSVATLSQAQARHIYEVRAPLEGLAGRLFALNALAAHQAQLAGAVERMADLVESPTELLAAKEDFYEALLAGGGNPELKRVLDLLHRRVTLTRVRSLAVTGRPAESVREMRTILKAATEGDPDETERLCVEHIHNAAAAAWGEEDGELV
jgi:DNA-binding GntR family transcriptional regulator